MTKPIDRTIAALAHAHSATEHSFAKYGHVYFFLPMAFDHIHTTYGKINALIAVAYGAAAFAHNIYSRNA